MTMTIKVSCLKVLIDDFNWPLIKDKRLYLIPSGRNYYACYSDHKIIYLHRLFMHAKAGDVVDHIDGNSRNNLMENLRFCTNGQNIQSSQRVNSRTGYRGVSDSRGLGYHATIQFQGKRIELGNFVTKEDAALAYNEAAIKYFGEHAFQNVITKASSSNKGDESQTVSTRAGLRPAPTPASYGGHQTGLGEL